MATKNARVVKTGRGLPIDLALGIERAIVLLRQGRAGMATDELKSTLLYATIADHEIQNSISIGGLYDEKF